MQILAIDPGVTTGFAQASFDTEKKILRIFPFQMVDEVDDLWRRLDDWRPRYIIMEDFQYRNHARAGLNLKPVQLIGVTHLYSLICKHDCALFLQSPAQGKGYYTDNILKKKALYRRGVPHGMDATRHLLHWFTFGAGNALVGDKHEFAILLKEKPLKDA